MDFKSTSEDYQWNGASRSRVKKIEALKVRLPKSGTKRQVGNNAPQPLSQYQANGQVGLRIEHTERGHLIGLRFGGPEASNNLVPMYGGFNGGAGLWGTWENKLAKMLVSKGSNADITIDVKYADKNTPVPSEFVCTVFCDELKKGFEVTRLIHPMPMAPYDAPTAAEQTWYETIQKHQSAMMLSKWNLEDEPKAISPGIAAKLLEAGGPARNSFDLAKEDDRCAFYASRPYSVFDYLWFTDKNEYRNLQLPWLLGGFQNTEGFSDSQIEVVKKLNRIRYQGYFISDLYGIHDSEGYEKLIPASTDAGIQVDHLGPKQHAGSNSFSNSRIVSSSMNKSLNDSAVGAAVDSYYTKKANAAKLKLLVQKWSA